MRKFTIYVEHAFIGVWNDRSYQLAGRFHCIYIRRSYFLPYIFAFILLDIRDSVYRRYRYFLIVFSCMRRIISARLLKLENIIIFNLVPRASYLHIGRAAAFPISKRQEALETRLVYCQRFFYLFIGKLAPNVREHNM